MRLKPTKRYLRDTKRLLTLEEKESAEAMICANPLYWPVIPGMGGVRKARAARGGKGKSGGVRIWYYILLENDTLVLLCCYAKNEREDLDAEEKKIIRKSLEEILWQTGEEEA